MTFTEQAYRQDIFLPHSHLSFFTFDGGYHTCSNIQPYSMYKNETWFWLSLCTVSSQHMRKTITEISFILNVTPPYWLVVAPSFARALWSHLYGSKRPKRMNLTSRFLDMRPLGCLETSDFSHQVTHVNIPEEWRPQLHSCWSLENHILLILFNTFSWNCQAWRLWNENCYNLACTLSWNRAISPLFCGSIRVVQMSPQPCCSR